MARLGVFSITEQVAAHLRAELLRGRWSGKMPGRDQLAKDLEVSRKTVELALKRLEEEGVLVAQGAGQRRRITVSAGLAPQLLRVAILPYEPNDRKLDYLLDLQYRLMQAGHVVAYAPKTLLDLNMDAKRVARLVSETEADAWVVYSGSREVLEWFAEQSVPAFALFGRRRTVRIASAGPNKVPALLAVTRRLIALGHRRISIFLREEHRKPQPSFVARAFLAELELHDIPTSSYNLPDWEDSAEGLRRCLDSLFRVTPPSALIIDEAPLFTVVQQHLARRGILAPEHVSLVCTDPHPTFSWFHPKIAHIRWDPQQAVRRILGWAKNMSHRKEDRRQTDIESEFVEGGSIGPVKEG